MDFKPKSTLPMRKEVKVALISTLSAAIFLGGIIGLVASADSQPEEIIPDDDGDNGNNQELIVFNPLTETIAFSLIEISSVLS